MELKAKLVEVGGGGRMTVQRFDQNILSGTRGVVRYRIDFHDISYENAAKFFKKAFGQDESIVSRSTLERKIPLEERWSKVVDSFKDVP